MEGCCRRIVFHKRQYIYRLVERLQLFEQNHRIIHVSQIGHGKANYCQQNNLKHSYKLCRLCSFNFYSRSQLFEPLKFLNDVLTITI